MLGKQELNMLHSFLQEAQVSVIGTECERYAWTRETIANDIDKAPMVAAR